MQKQGPSDSKLLNEAIAIAAEQRVGLSDANDVAYSNYQVSSPTVSQFRQQRVSISHTAPSYDPLLFVQHQPLYPTQYAHLQGLPYPFPILMMNPSQQLTAVFPSSTFLTSFTLPHYT